MSLQRKTARKLPGAFEMTRFPVARLTRFTRFTRPRHLAALAATTLALVGAHTQALATPFVGQIMCGGFNFAPIGWIMLDGSVLPIAQFETLFALIGTTYGGDGQQTFIVPDMRGRFLKHDGQGAGLSAYTVGQTGGAESANLTSANLPAHTHGVSIKGSNSSSAGSPAGAVSGTIPRTPIYGPAPGNTQMAATTTSTAGSANPAPIATLSPYTTINCFIAVEGIFPSPS
jgi:microcystin-dependent protein